MDEQDETRTEAPPPDPEAAWNAYFPPCIPRKGQALPLPLYPGGVEVTLNDGRTWTIPEFDLYQIHGPVVQVYSRLLRMMVALADEHVTEVVVVKDVTGSVMELVHLALCRNYPTLGLTPEATGKLVSFSNAKTILAAIYDLSGFVLETLRRLGIAPTRLATKPNGAAPETPLDLAASRNSHGS